MPIIGLTGGIASGKTLVGNILEGLGAVCVDADVISHEVMQLGTPCYNALRAQFDDPFTDENGQLDRRYMRNMFFGGGYSVEKLNAIVHPFVIYRMHELTVAALADDRQKPVIWSVPLLVESGLYIYCDEVLAVEASVEKRIERIMRRDSSTREQAVAMIGAQVSDKRRRETATRIISNDGSIHDTQLAVERIWSELLEKYSKKH